MIAYLDCSSGVSGDKFLGALLDAGSNGAFTATDLQDVLDALVPEARAVVERVSSRGVSAQSVRVVAASQPHSRTWASIRAQIEGAALPEPVRRMAIAAFGELARAEALVHGSEIDTVHFHEVGALDSIMDVVGICAGLHALGVTELVVSPVAVGGGTVRTSHGVLPVPAPATAELLKGIPTLAGPLLESGLAPGELTTPTGAALVRTCAAAFGPSPAMTPELVGYGAGTRDIGSPNVCRITLGQPAPAVELAAEAVALLETNIDHLSPEAAAFAAEQLMAEGALDVWTSPIVMKKGRSAYALSVLAAPADAGRFAERIVGLTGSLGVRHREIERLVAAREIACVETPFGVVRYKLGPQGARPEADDVARIAAAERRGFDDVERELLTYLGAEQSL